MNEYPRDEGRLSERGYWQNVHRKTPGSGGSPRSTPIKPNKSLNYSIYLMWDGVLKKHLPYDESMKVLEIGSAPGNILLRYRDYFGYDLYGVDYSEDGVDTNRALFRENGLDEGHILMADFFSSEFQDPHDSVFDVVASHGFIEHFDNPVPVIQDHIDLARPGGFVVITIPNFTGFNGLLLRLIDRDQLDIHNLGIMTERGFGDLFRELNIETLHCGYVGTCNLSMFQNQSGGWRSLTARGLNQVQRVVNVLGKALMRVRGLENRFLSPYLVFVGRKPK